MDESVDLAVAKASVPALGYQLRILSQGGSLYAAFGKIPDPKLLCPRTTEEWEIQNFNMTMDVPNRFSKIDQVGDWIRDCACLNRENIGLFLSEPRHEQVLEYIAYYLAELNSKLGLVDNLKIFLAVAGALEIESLENGPSRIKVLLEFFSKGFSEHNALDVKDWSLIADIAFTLLQMSRSIQSGQSIVTLQNFFVDIRALNVAQNVLPSRVISDIYSDFCSIGPFRRIKARKFPDYLLMDPLRKDYMTVYFGFNDNDPKECLIVITKTVLYIFDLQKKPFACVPFSFTRASLGRLMLWTVELYPVHGAGIPLIKFEDDYFTRKIDYDEVTSIPVMTMKINEESQDYLHSWFDLLENCGWECRQE